jgi:hypothetical protein
MIYQLGDRKPILMGDNYVAPNAAVHRQRGSVRRTASRGGFNVHHFEVTTTSSRSARTLKRAGTGRWSTPTASIAVTLDALRSAIGHSRWMLPTAASIRGRPRSFGQSARFILKSRDRVREEPALIGAGSA